MKIPALFFAPSGKRAIYRCLAVLLPCALIGNAVAAVDEWSELFNGSAVKQESVLDAGVEVWPVVRSMMTGDVNESERWSKRGPEGCVCLPPCLAISSDSIQCMLPLHQFESESVSGKCSKQSANECGVEFIRNRKYQMLKHLAIFVLAFIGASELMLWLVFRKTPNV